MQGGYQVQNNNADMGSMQPQGYGNNGMMMPQGYQNNMGMMQPQGYGNNGMMMNQPYGGMAPMGGMRPSVNITNVSTQTSLSQNVRGQMGNHREHLCSISFQGALGWFFFACLFFLFGLASGGIGLILMFACFITILLAPIGFVFVVIGSAGTAFFGVLSFCSICMCVLVFLLALIRALINMIMDSGSNNSQNGYSVANSVNTVSVSGV